MKGREEGRQEEGARCDRIKKEGRRDWKKKSEKVGKKKRCDGMKEGRLQSRNEGEKIVLKGATKCEKGGRKRRKYRRKVRKDFFLLLSVFPSIFPSFSAQTEGRGFRSERWRSGKNTVEGINEKTE